MATEAGVAAREPWWQALAEAWARLRGVPLDPLGRPLPRARVRRHDGFVSLQFVRGQTQSRMRGNAPEHLLIDYTRTMLGVLLWNPRPARVGIVGLGGGSQVKFLHRHLAGTRLEVVENHPGVIAVRREFGIPDDDARLEVVLDDGARFVATRPGRFDLLLVDGYDARGIPASLATVEFHRACRAALAPGGALASNLHGDQPAPHVERLREAFGQGRVRVVEEPRMNNRVVFAWVGDAPGDGALDAACNALSAEGARELRPALARVARELARPDPWTP